MIIDFARSILNYKDANSTEFNNQTSYPVIIDMPEFKTDIMGGTMRLGKRMTIINDKDSLSYKIYNNHAIFERHRHRYEVNPD